MSLKKSAPVFIPSKKVVKAARLNPPGTFSDSPYAAPPLPMGEGAFPSVVYARAVIYSQKSNMWWDPKLTHAYIFCYDCYLNYLCPQHLKSSHTYHFSEYVVKSIPVLPMDVQRLIVEAVVTGRSSCLSAFILESLRLVNKAWRKLVDSTNVFANVIIRPRLDRSLSWASKKMVRVKVMGPYYGVCADILKKCPGFRFNDTVSRECRTLPFSRWDNTLSVWDVKNSTEDLRCALQKCVDGAQWVITEEVVEEEIIQNEAEMMKIRKVIIETRTLVYNEDDLHGDYEIPLEEYYSSDSD